MRGMLFVATPGSLVSRKDNNIVIENENSSHKIPIGAIEHVFLFGGVHITTPAVRFISSHNRFIFLLNQFGKMVSVVVPEIMPSDYRIRVAQYETVNDEKKKLKLIEILLKTKAKNIGYIIGLNQSKYNRKLFIKALEGGIKFSSLNEALGVDGNLNHAMFEFFREEMLPDEFEFNTREYNPPKDPVNALLSLTYSIYYSLLIPLSVANGFDPYLGFFHIKRGRHASFASDVIEVSRPWLTLFVFKLLKDGFFHPMDFDKKENGYYLRPKSLKAYIKVFTERIIHSDGSFIDYSVEFLKKIKGMME